MPRKKTSLSKQKDNSVNGTKNGATPGKVCVKGQGTPGHLATLPRWWNVQTVQQVGKLEDAQPGC